MPIPLNPTDDLEAALASAYPELGAVREAAGEERVYVVGGSVRDLLLGRPRSDLDLVIVGNAASLAARLSAEVVEHERFATAKVGLDEHVVDIAAARAETYSHPGALPQVEPTDEIAVDLARRDFTINAMAIPLWGEPSLIDPHSGHSDLVEGVLRVLHRRSFEDDPTRALRAARYAARFGFTPEPETAALLRTADLRTVSEERREADLLRLAAEPNAARGFELLEEWGLIEPRPGGTKLAAKVADLLSAAPWKGFAPHTQTILVAALGPPGSEERLAEERPERPSEAVELARHHKPVELAIARALGAEWLDRYIADWRNVGLEIDGRDLLSAGVPQGPAVGRGLAEALRRKLDGELSGREEELNVALRVAGGRDGVA